MSKIKILLSALAVVVGIGGAFASKLDEQVTLYQTSEGIYEKLVNPTGSCLTTSQNPCTITYPEDPDPNHSTFTLQTLPQGGTPSQTQKIWVQ